MGCDGELVPYHCPICWWWHVGSPLERLAPGHAAFIVSAISTFVNCMDEEALRQLRVRWGQCRRPKAVRARSARREVMAAATSTDPPAT